MIDANIPFTVPLVLRVVDSNGIIITDGPDSSLNVVAEIDPPSACLSTDSEFSLVKGVGTFPGSVCGPGDNIRLRFSTMTSSNVTLMSDWTPLFSVTGEGLRWFMSTHYSIVSLLTPMFHLLPMSSICYSSVPFIAPVFYLLPQCSICYPSVSLVTPMFYLLLQYSICYPSVSFVTPMFYLLPWCSICYPSVPFFIS